MANKKITELDAATTLASTDVVPVVDVSADETKKITATNLFRTLPDGTAAAPALAFSSDQANGVYLAGTDTVGISTGGTQRVTVDGSGNVTISGDLTVSGATTTVESTTVTIDDKNIELGSVASPSNTTADGGGITLKGATDKTIKWINSTGYWTFNTGIEVGGHLQIDDSNQIRVGTGADLVIRHNGTDTIFENDTGHIYVSNYANDKDITLRSDDGSGAVTNYILCDGSEGNVRLYHYGTQKLGTNSGGIDVTGEVQCDSLDVDGTGDISGQLTVHGPLHVGNELNLMGNSDAPKYLDVRIGSDAFTIRGTSGGDANHETMAQFFRNGPVYIFYDNSRKFATKSDGIDVTGEVQCDSLDVDGAADITGTVTLHGNLDLQDSDKILLGTGDDLEIYHDGSNSFIKDAGTGELKIAGTTRMVNGANSETLARFVPDGVVELFHNNAKKFSTKSDGIDITGEVQCDSLDVDGAGDISGNLTVDSGTLHVDATNNRVGIGTSSADGKLDVFDGTNVDAYFGTNTDSVYLKQSGTVTGIQFGSNRPGRTGANRIFQFNRSNGVFQYLAGTNGSETERIRISNSGNVAIGNTSADGRLHVRKDGTGQVLQIWQSDLGTNNRNIQLKSPSSDSAVEPFTFATGNSFAVQIDSSEAFRIDSSGNCGIGVTTPGGNLHVQGGTGDAGRIYLTDGDTTGVGNSTLLMKSGATTQLRDRQSGSSISFLTADTQPLTIDSSCNVGIGVSSPSFSNGSGLEIQRAGISTLRIEDSSGNGAAVEIFADDGNMSAVYDSRGGSANLGHQFRVNGSEKARIDSSGNVGIGVSSPEDRLHIKSNASSTSLRVSTDRNSSTYGNSCIVFDSPRSNSSDGARHAGRGMISCLGNSAATSGIVWLSAGSASLDPDETDTQLKANQSGLRLESDGSLEHWASNNARFVVSSDGKAGINGITDPKAVLDVGRLGSGWTGADPIAGTALFVHNGNNLAASPAAVQISGGSTSQSSIYFGDEGDSDVGSIQYFHSNNALVFRANNGERMRLTSTGLLGIGTSSPAARLDVKGNAVIGATTGTAAIEVGLGATENRNALIDFVGDTTYSDYGLRVQRGGGGANSTSYIFHRGTGAFRLVAQEAAPIAFWTSNTERFRVTSGGNVGIGTSSPDEALDVRAGSYANNQDAGIQLAVPGGQWKSGLKIKSDSSGVPRLCLDVMSNDTGGTTEVLSLANTGNVGIGTSSPATTLELKSDANAQTTATIPTLRITNDDGSAVANDITGSVEFFSEDTSDPNHVSGFMRAISETSAGVNYALTFGTKNSSIGDAAERFRITSTGAWAIEGASNYGTSGQVLTSNGNDAPTWQSPNAGAQILAGNTNVECVDTGSNGHILFDTEGSERMRISSGGEVCIGGTSTDGHLEVRSSSAKGIISRSTTTQTTNTNKAFRVRNNSATDTFSVSYRGLVQVTGEVNFSNHFRVNQTTTNTPGSGNTTLGCAFEDNGANGATLFTSRSGNFSACFNRAQDGTVVQFNSGGNAEGDVSISGSTTSYNGAHLSRWSQLAGNAERIEILRGSVLSNLDEMCEWAHAAQDEVLWTTEDELPEGVSVGDVKTPARDAYTELNEQLNRMKVSDVEGDRNVAGVFQSWDDDDDTFVNDFYCAVTGDFVIRIAQGTTVARGDLLMSAGDGTAKPQDDDIVRSKTVAKVTSTTVSTTYADGSYCVPCVLMAC